MNIIHNEGMKISSACTLTPLYPYTHFQGRSNLSVREGNRSRVWPFTIPTRKICN